MPPSALKREFSGMEEMSEGARAISNASLRFLGAMDPPIAPDAFEALKALVTTRACSMNVIRCLGHDGLAEAGVTSSIDRALILATVGDDVPQLKRVVKNTGKKTREFEVQRVSFFQLKAIDPVSQSFHAHVYFEFVVRGAADDPDLMEKGDDFSFPYPPLAWFWNKYSPPWSSNRPSAACGYRLTAPLRKRCGQAGRFFQLDFARDPRAEDHPSTQGRREAEPGHALHRAGGRHVLGAVRAAQVPD